MIDDDSLIPDPVVARDFNVVLRTLKNWEDHDTDFPKAYRIRKRKYRRQGDLRTYKERRAAAVGAKGNAGWQVTQTHTRDREGKFTDELGQGVTESIAQPEFPKD
jgi:hypothetical protein